MQDFCFDCGNNKLLPSGEMCHCVQQEVFEGFDTKVCNFIPEDYGRLVFNESLLPTGLNKTLRFKMTKLYREISNLQLTSNVFLYSPPKTGKTVLAYSTMTQLIKKGVNCFPFTDIMEVNRIITEVDKGKSYLYRDLEGYDIDDIYKCKYLFLRVNESNRDVVNTIVSIVNRRSRRGNYTILLSVVPWNVLTIPDAIGTLKGLKGDGILGTIEVIE